jgi:hypothetical protein
MLDKQIVLLALLRLWIREGIDIVKYTAEERYFEFLNYMVKPKENDRVFAYPYLEPEAIKLFGKIILLNGHHHAVITTSDNDTSVYSTGQYIKARFLGCSYNRCRRCKYRYICYTEK